jgi:hypothetical protein
MYGNTNASLNGAASVALGGEPDILGSGFCIGPSSNSGTACLLGTFTANLAGGYAYFTDLFVKFAGPNFSLMTRVILNNGLSFSVATEHFHVLPHPPRIAGITFSDAFTHLILSFDSPTNFADMKGSGSCEQLFTSTVVKALGPPSTPRCDWRNAKTVWILFGNPSTINPNDCLSFQDSIKIYATMSWVQTIQTNGIAANQQVQDLENLNVKVQFTSPGIRTPTCYPASIPTKLEAIHVLSSEMGVTVSAVKYFRINQVEYFFVANFCSGDRCRLDQNIQYTIAKVEINSTVFMRQISADGSQMLIKIQDIPTQGPLAVLLPCIVDTNVDGGLNTRQFLLVVNSKRKSERQVFALGAVDVWVWRDRGPESGFELRQEITFEHRPLHASVIDDNDGVLLAVVTEQGVIILRWVEGSFRASDGVVPSLYNWRPGEAFGWVPGQFLEKIQILPVINPSYCLLHRIPSHPHRIYLAVADSEMGGGVKIYQWDPNGCLAGCFQSQALVKLSAVAPRSVGIFSAGGEDFIVVANYAEGSPSLDQVSKVWFSAFLFCGREKN